ncbi:MAG: ABC transporter ATP-binding protein [Rubrivivax sp.]
MPEALAPSLPLLRDDTTPLLRAEGLVKRFQVGDPARGAFAKTTVSAVDGIDLELRAGECFGLVGESGSGKTTVARLLLRLADATAGRIVFDGEDITHADGARLRGLRAQMQIVFQNPHSALNGRHTIFDAIGEPLRLQRRARGAALARRVHELMDRVSLPRGFAWRYPHELSGGQKQRVCIARALALDPRLVVLDEPTSALDVSVQAQILALLRELQRERQLTYLFISHNLAVVRHLCDRLAVMYLGKVLEQGDVAAVFERPSHPYTQALLAAVPRLAGGAPPALLSGDIPSPSRLPLGCRFHTRCAEAQVAECRSAVPPLREVAPRQACACWLRGGGASGPG